MTEFDREMSFLTRELIEGIISVEKCYDYIAQVLVALVPFLKKYSDEPHVLLQLKLLARRIEQFLPKNDSTNELYHLVKRISLGKIPPEEIQERVLKFITPWQTKLFEELALEEKIPWINRNKMAIHSLNLRFKEWLSLIKQTPSPLTFLDLSKTPLSEPEFLELLPYMQHVEELILQEADLSEEVLKNIFNLKELNQLEISSSSLKLIPPQIGNLKKLQSLNLARNLLSSIPSAIGKLENLNELNLNDNLLEDVPLELANLNQLRILHLSSNKLKKIPQEITKLKTLQKLALSKNELTELPQEIGELTVLKKLNLAKNWLKKLPASFRNLKDLQDLNLSHNQFPFFPEVLINLPSLKRLDITGNAIPSIPSDQMKNTEILN